MADYVHASSGRGRRRRRQRGGTCLESFLLLLVLCMFYGALGIGAICELRHSKTAGFCPISQELSFPGLVIGCAGVPPITLLFLRTTISLSWCFDEDEEIVGRDLSGGGGARYSQVRTRERKWMKHFLYTGRFFSSWGDRMWQFTVPIVLIEIFKNTLLPGAVLSLVVFATSTLLLPWVDSCLDRTARLRAMLLCSTLENLATIASCICLGGLVFQNLSDEQACALTAILQGTVSCQAPSLSSTSSTSMLSNSMTLASKSTPSSETTNGPKIGNNAQIILAWFTCVALLAMFGELMNQAQAAAMEKDWVVTIAKEEERLYELLEAEKHGVPVGDSIRIEEEAYLHGFEDEFIEQEEDDYLSGMKQVGSLSSHSELAKMNQTLVRIDLLCKVLAPISIGVVLDRTNIGNHMNGDTNGDVKTTVRIIMTLLTVSTWNLLALVVKWICHSVVYRACPELAHRASARTGTGGNQSSIRVQAIRLYFTHPVCLASLAFACLYFTVLDGGTAFLSYMRWRGIPASWLGVLSGVGALMGILGTFVSGWIHRCTRSLTLTGLATIWMFFALIVPCALAFDLFDHKMSYLPVVITLVSVGLSRFGLWAFDLTERELIQERVEDEDRGKISGVETILIRMALVGSQLSVMIYHNPENFVFLVNLSVFMVFLAATLYTAWYVLYDKGPYQVVDEMGALRLHVHG